MPSESYRWIPGWLSCFNTEKGNRRPQSQLLKIVDVHLYHHHLVQKLFLLLNFTFIKKHLALLVWSVLGSLFCSVDLLPRPHSLHYYVLSLEVR